MDFDSYSERLADLNEFSKEFLKKPKKIDQKRFQIINESMQMKSVSKIQFGQLNNKRFFFFKWFNIFAIWTPLFTRFEERET